MRSGVGLESIPKEWHYLSIGEYADVTKLAGYEFTAYVKYVEDGEIIALRALNAKNGKLVLDDVKRIKKDVSESLTRSKLYVNDIVFTYVGTIGEVAIIKENDKYHLAPNIAKITVNTEVDPDYLVQYLRSPLIKSEINKMLTTTSQPALSMGNLRKVKTILPPLPEQQKIASILSTVDQKIENIDQQIKETQELKKGMMQRLLTKGIGHTKFKDSPLGEIPESWEVVKIQELLDNGRILSHLDGNHGELYPKSSEFTEEGIPYVGANSFLNGEVDFSKCKRLSLERSLKFKKGVAKCGDVLFAHNATVGPVAYLRTELDFVILSTSATYYRLDNDTIDSKYWMCFLSSPAFKHQYEKVMGQSTRNQVPITTQRTFLGILPTFEEQKRISNIVGCVDDKLKTQLHKRDEYDLLKKGLMQQLLTGEKRVQINTTV